MEIGEAQRAMISSNLGTPGNRSRMDAPGINACCCSDRCCAASPFGARHCWLQRQKTIQPRPPDCFILRLYLQRPINPFPQIPTVHTIRLFVTPPGPDNFAHSLRRQNPIHPSPTLGANGQPLRDTTPRPRAADNGRPAAPRICPTYTAATHPHPLQQ